MNKERLIEEIRKYNLLYDLNDCKYNDVVRKDEAWKEISHTIGISVSSCKKTWANLREAHRRAIKRKITKSGQSSVCEKKWQYEDEMSFLMPHLKERVFTSTALRDSDQESTFNDDSQTSAVDHQSDAILIEDRPTSGCSTNTSKFTNLKNSKRPAEDKPSTSSLLMKYVLEEIEESKGDDIDIFFSGIAATVKRFSEYNKVMIKSQIFNIVSQMELQEIDEKRNKMR